MSLYAITEVVINQPDGTKLTLQVTHLKMEAARLDEDTDHRPFTLCCNVLSYECVKTTTVAPPVENIPYEKLSYCGTGE